jgi:hypothetical protein
MNEIYTAVAESIRAAAGISKVGVPEAPGEIAMLYGGVGLIKAYMDGTRKIQMNFTLHGADTPEHQKALIERLMTALDLAVNARIEVQGLNIERVMITNYPTPTVRDNQHWVYSADLAIIAYYKKESR